MNWRHPSKSWAFATALLVWITATPTRAEDKPTGIAPSELVQTWTHSSGATIYLVEKNDFPFTTFSINLRSGALWDPPDKPGLATLTGEMMLRGAADRNRDQFAEAMESLGSEFDVYTGRTSIAFDGDALSRNLDNVMALVSDTLLRPRLEAQELAKLKREQESHILQTRDNDRQLARRFFTRYMFGAHPYARPTNGTLKGIEAVTLDDIKQFYSAHIVAKNMIFGFAGDVTKPEANRLLSKHFSALKPGAPTPPSPSAASAPKGRQVLLVDKPDRTQNQIVIGHLAPTIGHPDQYALDVVNTLFGGTFTARLNHEVREKRGLSYGAYSGIGADRYAGTFRIGTYPASKDGMKTIHLLLQLFEDLRKIPLEADELNAAKEFLINSFAFRLDTPEKVLTEMIHADLNGLPSDYLDTYITRIRAVGLKEANAAVQTWLDPDNFLLVMLCTAAGFEEPTQAIPGVTTVKVVPYDTNF